MIQKSFEMKALASYGSPEVELIFLDPEENFLESGQLGNVGEGDPGEDEWFN
jgi:hypothetical protein